MASSPSFAALGREVYGDAFCLQLGYAGTAEFARIVELTGIRRGCRVLDVCAGAGGVAAWLELLTGVDVVALDCAAPLLAPRAVIADAQCLPFQTASLDAIICLDGFASAAQAMLAECARVLRDGGRLAFLLSLPASQVRSFAADVETAGLRSVCLEPANEAAIELLGRLESAHVRRRRELEAEVGVRLFRGLQREVSDLLRGLRSGRVERVYVSGER